MNHKSFFALIAAAFVAAVVFFLWAGRNLPVVSPKEKAMQRMAATVPPTTSSAEAAAPAASSSGDALPSSLRSVAGAGSQGGGIFTYISRPDAANRWESQLDAPTHDISYVSIDREAALGKKSPFWKTGGVGTFALTLPNGRVLPIVIDQTQQQGAVNSFVSEGRIAGDLTSRALFAFRDGEMSALIESASAGAWQLRAMADGVSQFYQVDPSLVPPCGVTPETNDPQKLALIARRASAAQLTQSAGSSNTTVTQNSEAATARANIRILIVYTDAVAAAESASAIGTQADLAIATMNSDLARSQVDVTVSLAGTSQVSYDETQSAADKVQDDALTRLADQKDGYMDSVHALRDQLGADLVCLALNRHDSKSAGLAYILSHPKNPYNDTSGFSVVQYSVMTVQSVFSHEIGHNLGCAHDRENSKDSSGNLTSGAYPYSYGYRFTGADSVQYRTIMAYLPGTRVAYFSNPDIIAPAPISHAVGSPEGQADQSDNARTIREDAVEVASYRLNTAAANGNAGILLNVSTRAFVSTGDKQLIGGFILSGAQPKRMLIRAIGPTLTQYGVNDALGDPVLRLVRQSDSATLGQNDNWGTGTNAGAVASAMTEAGAFVLPSGSRDSAVVATLQPGGYTAIVEGVNGSTGTALVEAYELDVAGSRLANLSTRAYAEVNKPMIGGFIIQADPGSPGKTKRVVVRVLGPSLANYGVTGAMDDPNFTLHDASGAIVLSNDDWTSTRSGTDDTTPVASTAAQQQLVATGLAPANRRDSAVLVDLPPGAYTAVVTPFVKLPDEPEKPGVAIVEVFEVLP